MSDIGILDWTNENSLSAYPLQNAMVPADLLVDASFIQFDGYVPHLQSIQVGSAEAVFNLGIDSGSLEVKVPRPVGDFFPGYTQYVYDQGRYVGALVFGLGLVLLFKEYLNRRLRINSLFCECVVKGVNSHAGVYSLAGLSGDVVLYTGASRITQSIFFDVDTASVVWNAGSLPSMANAHPLKSVNGVVPILNSIYLDDSELVKVSSSGSRLHLDLVVPLTHNSISPTTTYS